MNSNRTPTLIIGFGLIIFSLYMLVALLTKLGATSSILDFWPVILIFVGLFSINPASGHSNGVPVGLIGLGVFGGLYRLGAFQTPQGQALLAVLLGFTGLVILVMVVSKPRKPRVESSSRPINRSNRS